MGVCGGGGFRGNTSLQLLRLFELGQQSAVRPQGEAEGAPAVVQVVRPEVLEDVGEKVGPLHAAARGLGAQGAEVDMEVVVGGLVVEVDPQLVGGDAIALQDGLLPLVADVLEQRQVGCREVSETLQASLVNYGDQVEIMVLFLVPFEVGQEDEAHVRVWILIDNPLGLSYLLQDVENPL